MYRKIDLKTSAGDWTTILRLSDGANIPTDPDNTDYQQYLKWVAEGNTPLPPDDTGAQS